VTRVVAGAARGRRLVVPVGKATRPTSDRAREGLFSTVEAMRGTVAGCRFLDLYAGSGAVGLEALSRGAAHVLLVENERRALAACQANVTAVALAGAQVRAVAAERLAAAPAGGDGYDVVVLDPPYSLAAADLAAVVSDLASHGWLRPAAVVVVERSTRDGEWTWPGAIGPDRSRRYGEATLWYGRAAGGSDGPGPGPTD